MYYSSTHCKWKPPANHEHACVLSYNLYDTSRFRKLDIFPWTAIRSTVHLVSFWSQSSPPNCFAWAVQDHKLWQRLFFWRIFIFAVSCESLKISLVSQAIYLRTFEFQVRTHISRARSIACISVEEQDLQCTPCHMQEFLPNEQTRCSNFVVLSTFAVYAVAICSPRISNR